MTGTEIVIEARDNILRGLAALPEMRPRLREELPGILNWWVRLGQALEAEGKPCDPAVLRDTIETVTTAINTEPERTRQQRRRMKRRRPGKPRRYNADQAAKLIGRHRDAGTCPNCGVPCGTFVSRIDPDEEGVLFGCPGCDVDAAYTVLFALDCRAELRARHEWEAMKN